MAVAKRTAPFSYWELQIFVGTNTLQSNASMPRTELHHSLNYAVDLDAGRETWCPVDGGAVYCSGLWCCNNRWQFYQNTFWAWSTCNFFLDSLPAGCCLDSMRAALFLQLQMYLDARVTCTICFSAKPIKYSFKLGHFGLLRYIFFCSASWCRFAIWIGGSKWFRHS
jgi:hypothetical protein